MNNHDRMLRFLAREAELQRREFRWGKVLREGLDK